MAEQVFLFAEMQLQNIYTYYTYNENEQDEEVPDNFLIRENGGEWREPLVEVEE